MNIYFKKLFPNKACGVYLYIACEGHFTRLQEIIYTIVVGLFWLNRVGLPPTVLGPNILSKRVKTGPTATQFGSACAQIVPRLPGARLWQAELFQMSYGRQIR